MLVQEWHAQDYVICFEICDVKGMQSLYILILELNHCISFHDTTRPGNCELQWDWLIQ